MPTPIVGIDLGTTNSVIARVNDQGEPFVVVDDAGNSVHPSIVSFHPSGSVVIGQDAKQRRLIDPRNTVYSSKRLLGRTFSSPEITEARKRMPYLIKEGDNELPVILTRAGEFAIPEISALLIDNLRYAACEGLGSAIDRAVITVPANFTEAQRSATTTAGAIAGITVVRVLNEPTAAALAYGHQRELSEVLAVYDFGGGTFDISIMRIEGERFEVLATAGNTFLGGDDLDEAIVQKLAEQFLRENGVDLGENETGMHRLRLAAEKAKIELGIRDKSTISLDEMGYGAGGKVLDLQATVTRTEFCGLIESIVEQTFAVCDDAMKAASVTPNDIGNVLLVGGTTRIPYIRQRVTKYFGQAPRTDIHPEKAVALGAGLQAAALEDILDGGPATTQTTAAPTAKSTSQVPANLASSDDDFLEEIDAVLDEGQETLISELPAPPLPAEKPTAPTPITSADFFSDMSPPARSTTVGMPVAVPPGPISASDLSHEIATEAAKISQGPKIFDVTPHSLSLRTVGGFCEPLLRRNQHVPVERTRIFSTSRDNQEMVRIQVCQGESRRFDDNELLGDLILQGLPRKQRGDLKIEITFEVDADGLLNVKAVESATGIEQKVRMEIRGSLDESQIEASKERLRNLS